MKQLISAVFILLSLELAAQEKMAADTHALRAVSGTAKEMLRLVSGEKGKLRNPEALRNLFLPDTRFTILNHNDSLPEPVETVSLEEFISMLNDQYYQDGYKEYELKSIVNEFNGIASVFQSFEGKDSEGVKAKGINSYQMVYMNNRWWISNVLWTLESDGVRIPKKYR